MITIKGPNWTMKRSCWTVKHVWQVFEELGAFEDYDVSIGEESTAEHAIIYFKKKGETEDDGK